MVLATFDFKFFTNELSARAPVDFDPRAIIVSALISVSLEGGLYRFFDFTLAPKYTKCDFCCSLSSRR